MKARKDEWFLTVGFCAFLAVMSLLFVLLPKSAESATEKRALAQFPISSKTDSKVATDMILSGEFGTEFETYMADHIPGRDFFVGLNAYVNLLSGRQIAKDIYVAQGDRLVEKPAMWNEDYVSSNVDAIQTLSEKIGKPIDFMIVPSAGWANRDRIVGIADPYEDEELIDRVYALAGDDIKCIDLVSVFETAGSLDDFYYKTDHHWTSLGAYNGYKAYMEFKNRDFRQANEFSIETETDFKGSTYSRAALWLTPGEELQMWTGSENLKVYISSTLSDYQQSAKEPHNGPFFKERLKENDKYQVFLDGNHSIVRIENPNAAGKGSILVLRDSYSHCFGPMLAESYETVVLLDMRSYSDSVEAMYETQMFDDVLVCYSIGNFMTDRNMAKILYE